ncbi:MAG TPA: cytochrome P450 [Acidimicrobiales bacterium]|jgi:cytochrome P450 family 142 subfamily A polypeptide 1|nr:cytochrome P450 [Acidimicrobiales bacterium]
MPTHPVHPEISLLAGEFYANDPHPHWAWMREHAPAYYDERWDVWALTRHADILAAERDPATFSNAQGIRPHTWPLPMMISLDDPQHLKRRKLVNRGFTPRRVRDHEADIRRITDHILDRICEKGECDFVWDVAAPLPLILIGEMLGFPADAYDDLLRWSDDMIRGTTSTDEAALARAHEAAEEFAEFQLRIVADRRANPADDMISTLVHAEVDGDRLDDESLIQEGRLLLIGGDETTRHVITGGMYALLHNPEQREKLAADVAAVMPTAIEEMLRWVTPVKNMSRTVQRDVEMHGQTVLRGTQVLLMFDSANRDESVFDDPYTFDVTRDPNDHLAFGFGAHFCLGNALARIEIAVMFERLFARLPDIELATDDPLPKRPSNFISGFESMPVRFTPSPPSAASGHRNR